MLDWIFEGIVKWISSIVSQLMDAVSGLFLNTLNTDLTAMEEYFPFVTKAFAVYGMGNSLFNYGLAVIPRFRRTDYGG